MILSSSCSFARRVATRTTKLPLMRNQLPSSTIQQGATLSSGGNEPPLFTPKRLMYLAVGAVAAGCLVGYNHYNAQSKEQKSKMLKTLHKDVLAAREAVGNGKYEEALNYYKQARFDIEFTKMSSDKVHKKVFLNIVDQLGHLAFELERWDDAEKYLTEAEMVMLQDGLNPIETNYLQVVYELAVIDLKRGRDKEALQRLKKCIYVLEIKLQNQDKDLGIVFAEGHTERMKLYGMALTEYGTVMLKMGELEPARLAFTKALDLCRSVLGETHEQTSVLCNNLAAVYEEMNDFHEAVRYAEMAVEIAMESAPHYVAHYKRNLGQVLLHKGETVRGRQLIKEASVGSSGGREKEV